MISAIKAEFRKLLTVRSTYVLAAVCLAFTVLVAFYVMGFLGATSAQSNPNALEGSVNMTVQAISLFVGLIGVLLVTHEYRYNTIMYTLTSSRRRWTVLAAKVIAISAFVTVLTLLLCLMAPYLMEFGLQFKDVTLTAQDPASASLLLRCLFYSWATAMFGVIIAFIVRSQVGAIVTLLVFPSVVEGLLSLALKENAKYLPFTATNPIVAQGPVTAGGFTSTESMWLVLGYIVIGLAVSVVLFQKRDAN